MCGSLLQSAAVCCSLLQSAAQTHLHTLVRVCLPACVCVRMCVYEYACVCVCACVREEGEERRRDSREGRRGAGECVSKCVFVCTNPSSSGKRQDKPDSFHSMRVFQILPPQFVTHDVSPVTHVTYTNRLFPRIRFLASSLLWRTNLPP